ncbi:MAG: S49 family peptidase [Candidatus Methanospirareceae archaeon]
MSRIKKILSLALAGVAVAVVFLAALHAYYFLPPESVELLLPSSAGGGDKIAIIEINGEIKESSLEQVQKLLDRAETEDEIKAVVLRINSGGGGAVASWKMHNAVKRLKSKSKAEAKAKSKAKAKAKTEKPVVAFISDFGASGAYLVAVAADKIIATPVSTVGSIGVLMVFPFDVPANASEKAKNLSSLSTGEFKDIFSDYRLNEREREYLNERLQSLLKVFLECVAEGRGMSVEEVSKVAHGGWFTGAEGVELGLVDETGDLQDAVEEAAELANLSLEDTKVVTLGVVGSRVKERDYKGKGEF